MQLAELERRRVAVAVHEVEDAEVAAREVLPVVLAVFRTTTTGFQKYILDGKRRRANTVALLAPPVRLPRHEPAPRRHARGLDDRLVGPHAVDVANVAVVEHLDLVSAFHLLLLLDRASRDFPRLLDRDVRARERELPRGPGDALLVGRIRRELPTHDEGAHALDEVVQVLVVGE